MTRTVRSRRAGAAHQPMYARMLRLRHLSPSGLLCFVFLEGAIALGLLLALAELVNWWGVLVLPFAVAVMVKFNDLMAGWLAPPPAEPVAARVAVQRAERDTYRPRGGGHATEWPPPRVRAPVVTPLPVEPAQGRSTGVVWFPPENGAGRPIQGGRYSGGEPVRDGRYPAGAEQRAAGPAVNTAPVRRPWTDEGDVRQQMARQSAVRRYE
ncbi:hypothetical protein [Actinoplanes awajinensis]|uniref:Uncharacterized protein n=1 Tax=Actinoplanes awajinensis subsp. mycoplanecinus TaxID=135947 RepID=A0A0X3VD12_9ACTN|nr:hypothetical protein ADL15_01065 [Actinoplanes awajinensis subsp. mycoplanecinus]